MNHEFLWLNEKRQYLLLDNDTWYDANLSYFYNVGDVFANCKVKEILTYEEYVSRYPETLNTDCKYQSVFISGIYIRTVINGVVCYNVDIRKQKTHWNMEADISDHR
jgi:hypothetical protein